MTNQTKARAFVLVERDGRRKFVVTPRTQYWTAERLALVQKRLHGLGYGQVYTRRIGWKPSNHGERETFADVMMAGVAFVFKGVWPTGMEV